MKKLVMAFALTVTVGLPAPVFADDFKPGDRVQGTAAFFLCGAQDDILAMRALGRQGDRDGAVKLGTDRCEQGRPGDPYIVVQTGEDAVCVRRVSEAFCLWAQRASLHPAGPQ